MLMTMVGVADNVAYDEFSERCMSERKRERERERERRKAMAVMIGL